MSALFRHTGFLVVGAAGAIVVAGCSSTHTGTGTESSPATSTASTPATSTAPTTAASEPTAAGLSKVAFISEANAVCNDTYTQISALPTPTGPTDYSAIAAYAQTVLTQYPRFSGKAKALIARSSDKDDLTAKWIGLDDTDFAAQKPLLQQMLTAAKAKQANQVAQLANQMDTASDHSHEVAAFLNDYGLSVCAKLETF